MTFTKKFGAVCAMFVTTATLYSSSEEYYMHTDFSSIPIYLDSNKKSGVLKDETSQGEDILATCNAINPSRDDKCYYPMGDLRNERDGWLNNNNGVDNECIKQNSSISVCFNSEDNAEAEQNATGYVKIGDATTCGDWKSGGDNILLSWLECDYDSLHLRGSGLKDMISFDSFYGKRNGATQIDTEADRLKNATKMFKEYTHKGNLNLIPLYGVKFFSYWPHKKFTDEKEIGNAMNVAQSDISINTLEQQEFMMELMATELSFLAEDALQKERKKLYR